MSNNIDIRKVIGNLLSSLSWGFIGNRRNTFLTTWYLELTGKLFLILILSKELHFCLWVRVKNNMFKEFKQIFRFSDPKVPHK